MGRFPATLQLQKFMVAAVNRKHCSGLFHLDFKQERLHRGISNNRLPYIRRVYNKMHLQQQ